MKKLSLCLAAASLLAAPGAFAQQPSGQPEAQVELSIRDQIPEGYSFREPIVSKVGPSVRKSYFVFKASGPDSSGYYKVPLILIETLDGKVITNEKLGDKWGWTGIRPGRSVGLGDPKHDLELREFTNGRDARIVGLADGYLLQIARKGETEPFIVKPTKSYEVQIGTIGGNHVLVELVKGVPTIYTLRSTTFYPDPDLTKLAARGGLSKVGFWSAWTSRTTEKYAGSAPAPAPAPAKAAPASKQ